MPPFAGRQEHDANEWTESSQRAGWQSIIAYTLEKKCRKKVKEYSFRNQLTFIVHNASLLKPGWK